MGGIVPLLNVTYDPRSFYDPCEQVCWDPERGEEGIRQDPLAGEKAEFSRIQKTQPNALTVRKRLEFLASAYEKALQNHDLDFARECQLQAARDIQFAEQNKMNLDALRPIAARLGVHIPTVKSISVSIGNINNYTPGHFAQKVIKNVTESGHDEYLIGAKIKMVPTHKNLRGGLRHFNIVIPNYSTIKSAQEEEKVIGELIMVPPNAPVSIYYKVQNMTTREIAEKFIPLVFSSANYSINETTPATLSIVNGNPYNLYVSSSMDGLVVIRNGRPEVHNAREEDVFQLAREALSSNGTIFQTHLIVYRGRSIVPENASDSKDVRRVLVIFNDGSYGIIHFSEYLDLYELGRILEKIPGINAAVNLDTGGSDVSGYHTADWELHQPLEVDPETSTTALIYVK